ncbi:hypothetical protein QF050_003819 [Arthrobacter sp. SLBN-112]|nr:hypothetical protein [Arthrobacter sp. SLBN-112]
MLVIEFRAGWASASEFRGETLRLMLMESVPARTRRPTLPNGCEGPITAYAFSPTRGGFRSTIL